MSANSRNREKKAELGTVSGSEPEVGEVLRVPGFANELERRVSVLLARGGDGRP